MLLSRSCPKAKPHQMLEQKINKENIRKFQPGCCCFIAKSCLTLCDPHGLYITRLLCPWNSWVSSVHRILQERILEWVSISYSRGPSRPRDQTCVSCIAGRFFTLWANRETPQMMAMYPKVLNVSVLNVYNFECIE